MSPAASPPCSTANHGSPTTSIPLNRWALRDRRTFALGDVTIDIAPPEYVIVRKLEFFREGGSAKHLEDIRGIVRQQGEKLDRALIEAKVAEHGLVDEWRQVGAG